MRTLTLTAASLALGLAACASPTPYEAAGPDGSTGYESTKMSADTYRVSFEGNAVTDRETVEKYMLYKAAQVAQNTGHDYFRFVRRDTDQQIDVDTYNTYTATPGLFGYGTGLGVGAGYGYPYASSYGYGVGTGVGTGPGYGGTQVTTDDSYEATGVIELYEDRPAGMSDIFDASDVVARLADEVRTAAEEDDDDLGYDVL